MDKMTSPLSPPWRVAALATLLLFWAALSTLAPVFAASPAPSPDEPWVQQSRRILDQATQTPLPDWAKPEITAQQREWARKIMEMGRKDAENAMAQREPRALSTPQPEEIRVFLTLGKGETGRARFRRQIEALVGQANVEVELRGLPEGVERIDQLIGLIRHLVVGIDNAPPINLAPEQFRENKVSVAPTVVLYQNGAAVARLSGSLEIGYLKRAVRDGWRGRLGVRGDTWLIAERDLMDIIRERWAKIDWAAKKQQAIDGYWARYQPTRLPKAREFKAFTIDPSIVVAQDIRTPDGTVIAHRGERVNALAQVPFTGEIIAFDGREHEQVDLAGKLASIARSEGLRPILLTQGLPGEPGFDSLAELQQRVGARVYLLDARVTGRFHLSHLPATVRSAGQVFEIRELPPKDTLSQIASAEEDSR